ncbi:hypothetical protein Pla52n_24120 [Stieleria varia]|uniref:F0F1-ATPase subunit n=1 Tax=Stieleria varia TaxID=2528005 RepID=A0A5C6AZ18_9BACT|nr:hypothetical protein Pla52n_24120 [Stieleria varia]
MGGDSESDSDTAGPLAASSEMGTDGESPSKVGFKRSGSDERGKPWMRFVGVGMEIALYTIVLGGIGHWLDGRLGTAKPFLTALFGLVGFCFGMYRLVRMAVLSQRRGGA